MNDSYVIGNVCGALIWGVVALVIARRVARAPTRSNTVGGLIIAGLMSVGFVLGLVRSESWLSW